MYWFNYSEYVVLIFFAQNAVGEVREASLVRAGAVGAVLRVEEQALGGDEGFQEVEVGLDAVGVAIELEDAAHPVEDVEEGSDSILISICCRCKSLSLAARVITYSLMVIPASSRVGPRKCQPPSLTRRTRSAEPPKLRCYADPICWNSPSAILVRFRIRLRLLSHRPLCLMLLILGLLV